MPSRHERRSVAGIGLGVAAHDAHLAAMQQLGTMTGTSTVKARAVRVMREFRRWAAAFGQCSGSTRVGVFFIAQSFAYRAAPAAVCRADAADG